MNTPSPTPKQSQDLAAATVETEAATELDAQESQTLSEIYSLLALTMRYPDKSFCDSLLFAALESMLEVLDWRQEHAAISQWRALPIDHVDELRIEYTRLFIAAANAQPASPYASVHQNGEGIVQGRSTERIRDFYRSCGFDLSSEDEPADHIAIELDFLSSLARDGLHQQESIFLHTLFRPWFTRFKGQCLQLTPHPFYMVSLQLIDFFTKEDE